VRRQLHPLADLDRQPIDGRQLELRQIGCSALVQVRGDRCDQRAVD
jgi:hypothetical protein